MAMLSQRCWFGSQPVLSAQLYLIRFPPSAKIRATTEPNRNIIPGFCSNMRECTTRRRFYFDSGFIGFDLHNGVALLHEVAFAFQPSNKMTRFLRHAKCRHNDFRCHRLYPCPDPPFTVAWSPTGMLRPLGWMRGLFQLDSVSRTALKGPVAA